VTVLGGLAAVSLVATLPLSLLSRQIGDGIVALFIGIPCAAVGVVVARRQPRNPLGWLLVVDRRFNRARYDAEVTVAAFAARLQDEVDLDSVRADLADVVNRTLEPAHLSAWLRDGG
jgi:hypothetical protein